MPELIKLMVLTSAPILSLSPLLIKTYSSPSQHSNYHQLFVKTKTKEMSNFYPFYLAGISFKLPSIYELSCPCLVMSTCELMYFPFGLLAIWQKKKLGQ